jgi:uncharacterized protein DUF3866
VLTWREARVVSLRAEWEGAREYLAALEGGGECRALAYPSLVGTPEPGDRVLLNTTALEKGLGTGGYAMIVAVPDRLPADPPPTPGHLVKARYTPLQAMVLGADEQESQFHPVLEDADDLLGLPVVVCDLHSSLPAVLAGLRSVSPALRVAYVMTDGGALPAWFSRSVSRLRAAGWLTTCITAGQAFGGDLEAVSVHSALLAARLVASCDVAVVTQGPGNLGTGTRWGFSGVQAGEVVNAAAVLGGQPVACLRISGADARDRHRGVSHHSMTAYGRVALCPADIVVPDLAGLLTDAGSTGESAMSRLTELGAQVDAQVTALVAPLGRHRAVRVPLDGLLAALEASPVKLSTMGRGLEVDPAAFLAAAAAGRHAASLVPAPGQGRRPVS